MPNNTTSQDSTPIHISSVLKLFFLNIHLSQCEIWDLHGDEYESTVCWHVCGYKNINIEGYMRLNNV
jgi:hypothetical protein